MQTVTGIIAVVVVVVLLRLLVTHSERYPREPGGPVSHRLTDDSVREFLLRGRKIEAIKAYREVHGVGLRDAKDAVERLARQLASSGH